MSGPKSSSFFAPEFRDDLPFSALRYVQEFVSYLDALLHTDMFASDRALTVRDQHRVLVDSDI